MSIEDAIRRAKLLAQVKRIERDTTSRELHPLRSQPQTEAEGARGSGQLQMPGVPLEPLPTIEISMAAAEHNRILVSDAQQREYPAADAAYRLLRTRLQNRVKQNNWFSVAIASPTQGDGKSVTALNLAISTAREKQKTVYLLDLDMRNPSLCRYLGLQDVRSLADYFRETAKPEDVLYQTSVPELVVAGAPCAVDGASEMLAGPRFGELLAHIRQRSPDAIVLLDVPPVNLTDEALLVGRRVEAFLIVVSEGKTERKQLAQTISTLGEFTIAGIIVNRSSDSHTTEYAYSQYSP